MSTQQTTEKPQQVKLEDLPNIPAGFTFKPKQDWHEYDLHTYHVMHENRPTDLQAIVYKGNFITFRHKNYFVFPHETIFETLDPVLDYMNGQPLSEHIAKQDHFELVYGNNRRVTVEADYRVHNGKHVVRGTTIRSTYLLDTGKFDVTGDGDIVRFGATLGNSIDGTGSLYISPFSERQVCSNGMMHLATVAQISEGVIANMLKKREGLDQLAQIQSHIQTIVEESKNIDDVFTRIKKERMSHMTRIPVEWITSRLYLIKESITSFKTRYRQMTEMIVSAEQAEKIDLNLPVRLVDKLDWLEVKKVDKEIKHRDGSVSIVKVPEIKMTHEVSQWKAFNDITEDLTHTARAFDSRTKHYKTVDEILVLQK